MRTQASSARLMCSWKRASALRMRSRSSCTWSQSGKALRVASMASCSLPARTTTPALTPGGTALHPAPPLSSHPSPNQRTTCPRDTVVTVAVPLSMYSVSVSPGCIVFFGVGESACVCVCVLEKKKAQQKNAENAAATKMDSDSKVAPRKTTFETAPAGPTGNPVFAQVPEKQFLSALLPHLRTMGVTVHSNEAPGPHLYSSHEPYDTSTAEDVARKISLKVGASGRRNIDFIKVIYAPNHPRLVGQVQFAAF